MSRGEELLPNYQVPIKAFAQAMSIGSNTLRDLWDTVINGAFENDVTSFDPVKDKNNCIIFHESLSRPVDDGGVPHKIYPLVSLYYRHNKHFEMDLCTCNTALINASEKGIKPISLNISVVSALSPEFFTSIKRIIEVHGFAPQDVVFEILEHDVDRGADIGHLLSLKKEGYRFALDDFAVGESHENRLYVFGDLVEFIKFDKSCVRGYLDQIICDEESPKTDENSLIKALTVINRNLGEQKNVSLIAEYVYHRDEIPTLKKLGFDGFQGEYSQKWDQDNRPDEPLAKQPRACDYE